MEEYDRICDWYAQARDNTIGVVEVTALISDLQPGSRVLDLGCGNGIPITQLMVEKGMQVYGIDSSKAMLKRYRAHFPNVPTLCARLQDVDYFGTTFDAVVAWGVLFHLSAEDQATAISKVGQVLKPGGRFLFTSALETGTSESPMNNVQFHYLSLGRGRYATLLEEQHMTLVQDYYDEWANYYYIAERMEDNHPPMGT